MKTQRLFYHLLLNLAWMQANDIQQFLFVGVCGCPETHRGQGGILINTLPQGKCNFCHKDVEMNPLHAFDTSKCMWLRLFTNKEGNLATEQLDFTAGAHQSPSPETPSPSFASPPDLQPYN